MVERYKFTLTNIIIALTVIAYFIQEAMNNGSLILGLNIYFLAYDFWWQPLSSMFAHGGMMHLVMNMFILYQFGNPIEKYRGRLEFIIIYFVLGILTSLLSFLYIYYIDVQVNLVGASGAICVILGYIAYLDKQERKGIIVWVALISIAPLLIGLPIAWWAHFIGFALGFVYAFIRK